MKMSDELPEWMRERLEEFARIDGCTVRNALVFFLMRGLSDSHELFHPTDPEIVAALARAA